MEYYDIIQLFINRQYCLWVSKTISDRGDIFCRVIYVLVNAMRLVASLLYNLYLPFSILWWGGGLLLWQRYSKGDLRTSNTGGACSGLQL